MIRSLWKLIKPNTKRKIRVDYTKLSEEKIIFICGYPRSGSTYLYQKFCHHSDMSYVTNLGHSLCAFSNNLNIINKREWKLRDSHEGFIKGLNAPSEANSVFELWFGMYKDGHVAAGLWKKVSRTNVFSKGSWVFAWNAAVFYYRELKILFPNAQFVIVDRDKDKIASSWRKACLKHDKTWGISLKSMYENEPLEVSIQKRMDDIEKEIKKLEELSDVRIVSLGEVTTRKWLMNEYGVELNDYIKK